MDLYQEARACTRCPLHQGRTKVVFGAGNADADLMFVGEAPGQQEDLQGIPFVGRAGKLLDQLLNEVGLERADVFITNVLKSRPPGNRDPELAEIDACKPYLQRQIELIEPKVIPRWERVSSLVAKLPSVQITFGSISSICRCR